MKICRFELEIEEKSGLAISSEVQMKNRENKSSLAPAKPRSLAEWHSKHVIMLTNPAGSIEMYLLWAFNKKLLATPNCRLHPCIADLAELPAAL